MKKIFFKKITCNQYLWIGLWICLIIFISVILSGPIEPSYLGLFDVLPIYYYFGLIFLLLIIIISLTSLPKKFLQICMIFLLICYTQILSPLLIGQPRIQAGTKIVSHQEYLLQYGQLTSGLWYHTWPGFFIFASFFLFEASNEIKLLVYTIYPIIYHFIITAFFFNFNSKFYCDKSDLSENKKRKRQNISIIAIVLFNLVDFINQDFYSPQSFALLFFFMILTILLDIDIQRNFKKKIIYLVFLIVVLIQIHLMMFLFSVAISILWFLYQMVLFIKNRKSSETKISNRLLNMKRFKMILILVPIVLVFIFFFQTPWFQNNGLRIISELFQFDFSAINELFGSIKGIPERIFTIMSRITITFIFGGLCFLSLVIFYLKYSKQKKKIINSRIFMFTILLILLVLGFTVILINVYSDELFQRMYLYSIPVISSFIALVFYNKSLNRKKLSTLFLSFIILFGLFIPAKFGNEKFDILYKGEIEAIEYIDENYPNTPLLGISKAITQLNCYNCHRYYYLKLDNGSTQDIYVEWDNILGQYVVISEISFDISFNNSHIVFLSKSYLNRAEIFDFQEELQYNTIFNHLTQSEEYSLIYSNEDALVFLQ